MIKYILLSTLSLLALLSSCSKDQAELTEEGISGSITRFQIYDGYLYGLNNNEVLTYDLTDPDHPNLVHSLSTDYGLETITIYEGTIYIGSTTSLYILGIENPAEPQLISQTERINGFSGCDPVVVKDNYAYSTVKVIENICGNISTESALIVYDVTDLTAPVEIERYTLDIPNGLGILGDYLLICDEGSDRVEVLDISIPKDIQLTDYALSLIDPVDLIINGDMVIISTKTSFDIFNATDITGIKKIASIEK